MKKNAALRMRIKENGLMYWQVAEAAGISSYTFSVWLRAELVGERKKIIEKAIDTLIKKEA